MAEWPAFPEVDPLAAEDITDLGNVVLQGDIRSNRWDGGSDLSGGKDTSATEGFFLDSSAGAIQVQNIFAEGGTFNNITILGSVITLNSGTSFPDSPSDGELFYRTDQNRAYRYDGAGSTWIELDFIPDSSRIASGAIATAAIANAAITNAKIDTAAVDTAEIVDAAITNAKIANLAVDTAEIADAAITNAKISDASVSKLTAGTIATSEITIGGGSTNIRMRSQSGDTNIFSSNFASGSTGWKIFANGSAEFQDATIRGTLNASDLVAGIITARQYRTASSGRRIEIDPGTNVSEISWYDGGGTEVGSMLYVDSLNRMRIDFRGTGVSDILSQNNDLWFRTTSTDNIRAARDGNDGWLQGGISFGPEVDNDLNLGVSGRRWVDVWAVDGSINTSDDELKQEIVESDLGLDFIRRLTPVRFLRVDGTRPHYGLTAQNLKDVLDDLGKDFAGYIDPSINFEPDVAASYTKTVIDPDTGEEHEWKTLQPDEPGPKGIRYHEFVGPIVAAIQELADRLDILENA